MTDPLSSNQIVLRSVADALQEGHALDNHVVAYQLHQAANAIEALQRELANSNQASPTYHRDESSLAGGDSPNSPQSKLVQNLPEAWTEIRRLTQENGELKFRDSGWSDLVERQAKQYALVAGERDRLHAALERIGAEFDACYHSSPEPRCIKCIANEALGPAQETPP